MKQSQHTTSSELKTTANDVVRWVMELRHLHARMAPFFARPEPRQRCLLYLQGILSDVARKNGWQLAEQAGETRPDGMQRRLRNAVWDESRVRDELRTYVLERLGAEHAIVAIDETSFRQQRRQIGGSSSAILWDHQTGRKLSGGGVSLLHQPVFATRYWTVSSTCLVIGWKTALAVKRPGLLTPCVFRPSVNWRGR